MNNRLFALVSGTVLWSLAGWMAHPREIWDAPTFLPVWGAATLLAGGFGLTRASRPLADTMLVFLPVIGVLVSHTVLTGGSASLLPLGLVVVALLALPGWLLALVARRLSRRR